MLMFNPQEIKSIIIRLLLQIKALDEPITGETLLYAKNGHLSSIELVMLIVDVEQELRNQYKLPLVIASSKAMSQKNSPFNSVNSFTTFIFDELNILNNT